MSSYVPVADQIKEVENWLRLATFLHYPLKDALLFVLHNKGNRIDYVGLPEDATELYNKLSANINLINKLVKNNVLSKAQVDILLPPGANKTDSSTFDVTLIIVLIINFTTLAPPKNKNGWKGKLDPTDVSTAAFVILARIWRNVLIHDTEPGSLCKTDFDNAWHKGEDIVKGLGLTSFDTKKSIALKNINLDKNNLLVSKSILLYQRKIQVTLNDHDKKLATIQGDVKDVENEVTDVKKDVTDVKKDVTDVKKDVKNIQSDVTCIKSNLNDIEHKVTNVQSYVANVKDDVRNVKSDVDDNKHDVTNVKYSIEAVDCKVDELKDEISENKEDIGLLKEQMGSIQHNPTPNPKREGT